MEESSSLIRDGNEVIKRAIQFDQEENYPVAVYLYFEGISIFERAIGILDQTVNNQRLADEVIAVFQKQGAVLQSKINEYRKRATDLQIAIQEKEESEQAKSPKVSEQELQVKRAYFLVNQALEQDELQHYEEALDLYTQAVDICLKTKSTPSIDEKLAAQVTHIAIQALERAENLKGMTSTNTEAKQTGVGKNLTEFFDDLDLDSGGTTSSTATPNVPVPALSKNICSTAGSVSRGGGPGGGYTENEKKVLLQTSIINGREYVPFMSVDKGERFAYPLPFSDGAGRLHLSPKQRKNFKEWARPGDRSVRDPKMIELVSCYSIKQTVISDCSFVASLAVSALYERRFNKRLITSIIYPQDKTGEPLYNPCGKYMIILHLNGVKRKIVIDDLLPVGHHGELLCSYSSNKGELWVSLLEKAYMKVMGGYDFPGSNSNIDLHALTGWIPERMALHSTESTVFDKDATFRMLHDRLYKGDVLVTIATGALDENEAERAGLVTCHAYAVLDIQVVKGVRLFQLKNPWSHLRWRGNYSELDVLHWTDELKSLLKYDPNSASMFDNGVFWIDYDSICKFFDVLYMNWNPKLFPETYVIHSAWGAGSGPIKDVYNIGENPQYMLEVKSKGSAAVWILLTRHITEIEDFKENREYITVLVYDANGKKVFYPYDPPPLYDGVRINSPHYLCKIPIQQAGTKRFTLVISQYEKMHTIYYSLRAYATCPIVLKEIVNVYTCVKKLTGKWVGKTAGGCPNHPTTYPNNPCYQLTLNTTSNDNRILVDLRARKDFQIGFDIICSNVSTTKEQSPGFFNRKSSGSYRPGFVVLELDNVPSGVYNIIPSTYYPNLEGTFFLTVHTTCDHTLKLIPPS